MANNEAGSLQSRKDFKDTPSGQHKYWKIELAAAEANFKDFRTQGTVIDLKFRGGKAKPSVPSGRKRSNFRLNLFHTNTITLQSMLYGNLPKVEVSRRYNDPNDDVGRVAALIMQRLLQNDVLENPETYDSVLKTALQDRLLPGLGAAKVRYEYNQTTGEEDAPLEYYHWRDILWGWARTYDELPWIAYRSYLDKDEVEKRFGKPIADAIELKAQQTVPDNEDGGSEDEKGPWLKAEIWEIWDKTRRRVVWWSPGYDKTLDSKQDYLKVPGFFPSPRFLVANQTSTLYIPTSDYHLAQDLYNEIDLLQTRISIISQAVKVVGAYDQSATELKRIFNEATDNDLIPVDNWALFGEGNGIKGKIDWVPIDHIADVLVKLRELRDEHIALLQQTTGMSDIMRGQLDGQYEGVGQSKMRVEFGSIRVQSLQEEFSTFASNLMKMKACIIGEHYSPETIAQLANVESLMDADRELIGPAIELIKNPKRAQLKIIIRPETMAMMDYAQLKAERTEFLRAVGEFMAAAGPLAQEDPTILPYLLQLLQWGMAGFRGANEIEGVLDKAIQVTIENLQNRQDDPDPEEKKLKAQAELDLKKHEYTMQEIQEKANQDRQTRQVDAQADITKIIADLKADLKQIYAKMQADIKVEAVTSQINAEQQSAQVDGEIEKDRFATQASMMAEGHKTDLEIEKIMRAAGIKAEEDEDE